MCQESAEEEGAGEETFGDPVKCYVGGELAQSGGKVTLYGYGGCSRGLPEGTGIKTCVRYMLV